MTHRLVIADGLDFTERQAFVTAASRLIEHASRMIEVDCSAIVQIDEPTVGMLVWLARNARRRGFPVILEGASPELVAALEQAGVADRFAAPS